MFAAFTFAIILISYKILISYIADTCKYYRFINLYNRYSLVEEKRPLGARFFTPNASSGFHDSNYFTHFRGRFSLGWYTGPYILTVTTILNDRINFYGTVVKWKYAQARHRIEPFKVVKLLDALKASYDHLAFILFYYFGRK